jgi:hypothetical protein
MKVWFTPNRALEQREPLGAEGGTVSPMADGAVGVLEGASRQEVWQAVRWAVRAYARDPSAHNASKVELAIAELRRQRMHSRR